MQGGVATAALPFFFFREEQAGMKSPRWVDDPPSDAAGWREVWTEKRSYRGPVIPGLFAAIGAMFERMLHPHVARQRDFNIVLTDLIHDLRSDLQSLRRDFETDRDQLRTAIQEGIPTVAARGDALIAALDQKIETLDSRIRDLSLPALAAERPVFRDDWTYRRFEEGMRGPGESLAQDLTSLVDLAHAHQPALDIGCGRGEFLRLASERGIPASGVDSNERSVADLRSRGLEVRLGAVPAVLSEWDEGSIGFVLATHVVEHLPFSPLVSLFHEVHRILRPGGLFAIETPNASSLVVAAGDLWHDPTHVAPRTAAAMVVIARETGFEVASLETVHPFEAGRVLAAPDGADAPLQELVAKLNALLYGDQDLRLVLRKR